MNPIKFVFLAAAATVPCREHLMDPGFRAIPERINLIRRSRRVLALAVLSWFVIGLETTSKAG